MLGSCHVPIKKPSAKRKEIKTKKRYELLWRNKDSTAGAESIAEMVKDLEDRLAALKSMQSDKLEGDFCAAPEDIIWFHTADENIAKKYGMHEAE